MTKFRAKHKAHAFLGAAFVLLIALMFTACKQPASAEKPEPPAPPAPPKHAVTFSVEGTPPNGTLKAILGTSEITSGDKVEEGKWVIFTAKADEGYRVKEWKLDGNAILGHKSNTYPHKVTKPCAITVSFEPYSVKLTLSPDKNTVKVKAKTADGSAIKVEGCTVTELTSDVETTLTAIGTKVTLIGDITELDCRGEKTPGGNRPLIALDASGCTALQKLDCSGNQLATLNVRGLTALQELNCQTNQLTTLNVQGLTKLQKLECYSNQLKTLNVQSCTALKILLCYKNKLNADAFTKLFNDLPAREVSDKAKALLYSDQTASEENCKDFSQPESLKKAFEDAKNVKHWKMQKTDHIGFPEDI